MFTRLKILLASICLCMALGSCASLPDPDPTRTTLVVGSIIMKAEGLENYNGATVNGTHRGGIEITFLNTSTKGKYQVTSGSDGVFYSATMPAGRYELRKCFYKATSGNYWASWYMTLEGDRFFVVEEGTVNNLGLIDWDVSGEDGNSYTLNKEYMGVREQLSKTFPKSAWLSIPWKNMPVTRY